jgi:phage shock protein A
MSAMAGASFVVACPCCQAKLTIDAELKAVVAHEEPPRHRSTADLGTAFDQLRTKSAEREARFKQQMEAEAQKGKLLDRKFQESLKKAKDSPDPPPRRYDYD